MTCFRQPIIWLFLWCCIASAIAQEVTSPNCTGLEQNVVYFGNGVAGNFDEALANATSLKLQLASVPNTADPSPICPAVAFNTSLGTGLDILETVNQLLANELPSVIVANILRAAEIPGIVLTPTLQDKLNKLFENEFVTNLYQGAASQADVANQVANYKKDLAAQKKVVVVAHSQGNTFVNFSYDKLKTDPALNQNDFARFAVIPVASPDYRPLGARAGWVTFNNDKVILGIQALRLSAGVQLALAANDTAENPQTFWVHYFSEDYLADPSAKQFILNGIISTLAALPPVVV